MNSLLLNGEGCIRALLIMLIFIEEKVCISIKCSLIGWKSSAHLMCLCLCQHISIGHNSDINTNMRRTQGLIFVCLCFCLTFLAYAYVFFACEDRLFDTKMKTGLLDRRKTIYQWLVLVIGLNWTNLVIRKLSLLNLHEADLKKISHL